MNVLILFGTTEGHTRDLCAFLQQVLTERGDSAAVRDAASAPAAPDGYDICLIAGSLHLGSYQPDLVDYVRRHHEALNAMPTAFISVSLSAAGKDPDDWKGLDECVEGFLLATSWKPAMIHHVAGAIRYSRYGCFKRLVLKFIASRRGQDTVTSRDYVLTDYGDLERFVETFVKDHGSAKQ